MFKSALRGLVAVCMMLIFCVVAFSPGTALAVEKSISIVMIANLPQMEPVKIAAGVDRYDKRSANLVSLSSSYAISATAAASKDGYMNWRMRSTTRSI